MSFIKSTLNPKDQNHLQVLLHRLPIVVQATWISQERFQFGFGDTWRFSTFWMLSRGPKEMNCWTSVTWILTVVPFHGRSERGLMP